MATRIAPVTLATDTEGVTKAASTGVRSSAYFRSTDSASSSVIFMACGIASGYSQQAPLALSNLLPLCANEIGGLAATSPGLESDLD